MRSLALSFLGRLFPSGESCRARDTGLDERAAIGQDSGMIVWPSESPKACFVERRRRFAKAFRGTAALASGVARVRNFEANQYPFRAESHFLYLVGRPLEEAVLYFDESGFRLFIEPPLPDDRLWHGPQPSFAQLSEQLGLEVLPLDEFSPQEGTASLAPSDVDSVLWLEDLLGRSLDAVLGGEDAIDSDVVEADAALARAMIELRLSHDEWALAQMRDAVSITTSAHLAGMRATQPGLREAVVRAAIEAEMTRRGACTAYGSIVTVQGNVLHHKASTGLMSAGDLLLVDAGAEVPEGWAADVTRTWPVSGRFDGFQAEVYDAVLAAQAAAIAAVRPGVRYRDVHRVAARELVRGLIDVGLFIGGVDELLEQGVAAAFFPHGVGHLLGLDVHDMEDLGDRAGYPPGRSRSELPAERYLRLDRDLQPGMVVTIEPGFYNLEGLLDDPAIVQRVRSAVREDKRDSLQRLRGIRIEDDVLVTERGREVLSAQIPKTRSDVEAAIQG